MKVSPPTFTGRGSAVKSATVVLGWPSSVPPPLLMATPKSFTLIVRSSIPTNSASSTEALSAVHDRRSVWVAGSAGAFGFISARARLTPLRESPMAPGLSAGPLTPAKA